MVKVQRKVQQVKSQADTQYEKPSLTLRELRSIPAWVLLGEPGAGKTQSFIDEAVACNGLCLRIDEFINEDVNDAWKSKTLFLDGLDEIRASTSPDKGILLKVRSRLRQLGNPWFRIACRAADWFGESDKADILTAAPDGELPVFNLLPLTEKDVLEILQQNFDVPDPKDFVKQVKAHGIDSLLKNPQMLKLLAESWQENSLPQTRSEVFEAACQKQAKEPNKAHRNQSRSNSTSEEAILDAAGYLFAVILLSDKSGIALDEASENSRYPTLNEYNPSDIKEATVAARRMMFVPSCSSQERIEPNHRSVAEYLAARWLAKQVDQKGLPLGRVLNLLLGFDQKTVAGLRGLYAWLALYSQKARHHLIEKDPLTVVLYGDVKPMSLEDKRQLLKGLKKEIVNRVSSILELSWTDLMRTLYDEQLNDEFTQILSSQLRDDVTQRYVIFILKVLEKANLSGELITQIKAIAIDDSWWGRVRADAIKVWLPQKTSDQEALDLLDRIRFGAVNDPDDQLAGLLLMELYPRFIKPQALLQYLHRLKEPDTLGTYSYFWTYELPKIADNPHLPILLDQLCDRTDLSLADRGQYHLRLMGSALLKRAVDIHGDSITDQRLYSWLSIGSDQFGENRREKEVHDFLRIWLSQRPDRYKGLLGVCFDQCTYSDYPALCLFRKRHVLDGVTPPDDMGLWHFQKMQSTYNKELVREHLNETMKTLMFQKGNGGVTFEMVLDWVGNDQARSEWIRSITYYEFDESRQFQIETEKQYQRQSEEIKLERTKKLSGEISKIRTGNASSALLFELAGVWSGLYLESRGETPLERFKNYCENYEEIYHAAQAGFCACIRRKDLPSIKEIVDLKLNQREHFFKRPCLVGMDLLWHGKGNEINALDEQILKRMVCFRLTDAVGKAPGWFIYLVEHKHMLVADVFFEYASRALVAKKDSIDGIYQLAYDTEYQKVALIVVPQLLNSFPLRIKSSQLQNLEYLLKSGLRYLVPKTLPEMLQLIDKKTVLKSVDVSQKVYWLTTGMLLAPEKYEKALWNFVGKSWKRANSVSDFLRSGFNDIPLGYDLSAQSLAKLIELLTPYAELDWFKGGGNLTSSMQLGDYVRSLISKLAGLSTQDSLEEMNRLLSLPSLMNIRNYLENARHELQQRMREKNFSFPPLNDVAQILSDKPPVNPADLTSLVLFHLDDIASEIRTSNSDLFRQFWNEKSGRIHKDEPSCRDALLEMLKKSLRPFSLDCQPESDHFNDKRADIRVSYKDEIDISIEIKGEWHSELWTSIKNQLVGQYTKSKNTDGYGIYIVLWIGGNLQKAVNDGGKKPTSPDELRERLSATIPIEMQNRIHVRVLDVSWPVA